jgi:Uri superfamily endonuclease
VSLRSAGGHYLLVLRLAEAATLRIGARPDVPFAAGWHVYAGSAQGSGGLAARLERHQRTDKRRHWHVDWLRSEAEVAAIWARPGATGRECGWVAALSAMGGQRQPPGFGNGDCRCPGHLVWFATLPDLAAVGDPDGRQAFQPWVAG